MCVKRFCALLLSVILCLTALPAFAEVETPFADDFFESNHLWDAGLNTTQSVAVSQDKVFDLLSNGEIYCWDPRTGEYSLYSQVPTVPEVAEKKVSELSASVKAQLDEAVFCLIGTRDALMGYNPTNGAIGTIDESGITWNSVHLDPSVQMRAGNAYPASFLYAFMEDDMLYAFFDLSWNEEGNEAPCQATLLAFDLSTGKCTQTQLSDTFAFCQYTPGNLLLLRDDGSETPVLTRYNLSSGEMTTLDITVPVAIGRDAFATWWTFQEALGGLAYDQASDTIYLAGPKGLWMSAAGAAFTEYDFASVPWNGMVYGGEAWTLLDGEYVFHNGYIYAVK